MNKTKKLNKLINEWQEKALEILPDNTIAIDFEISISAETPTPMDQKTMKKLNNHNIKYFKKIMKLLDLKPDSLSINTGNTII